MSIQTASHLPTGLEALERKIADTTLSPEEREGLWIVAENLSKPSSLENPRASNNGWVEMLYRVTADTTISASSSETIMVPDYTLPANYMNAGRVLRYTLLFDISTAITTPGTYTFRLRYGGVGGTTLATSGAFAPDPTAAATQTSAMIQWWVTMRADGTSGSAFAMGNLAMTDVDDASATTIVGNLNMQMIPTSSPAAVTINTTTANALSPTSQASVTTGSSRTRMAFLEALN